MFSKSASKEKDELVLIFDIGSSSVGGAFFEVQKNGIPKIVYSLREEMPLLSSLDVDKFLTTTLESLKVVTKKIHDQGLGSPDRMFCVLSSPWYISQTRTIKLEKNSNFTFTSKLADDLVQKEIALFEEQRGVEYGNMGNKERVIELKNIRTSLNGYETPKPLNQQAKNLEMVIFVSTSPEEILNKINDSISKFFHTKELKFISSALSSFIVVRDLFTDQKNFLLINIGGELTDIYMTKKDILRESISFPLGINFFIRGIAQSLSYTTTEAKSLLSLYREGHASVEIVNKVEPIINKLKREYLQKFKNSLASLSNDISIPADIYIIVDRDWAQFFIELIKTEQFNQYTLAESKFKIIVLGSDVLHGISTFEDGAVRDPFLIIGSVYVNRHIS